MRLPDLVERDRCCVPEFGITGESKHCGFEFTGLLTVVG